MPKYIGLTRDEVNHIPEVHCIHCMRSDGDPEEFMASVAKAEALYEWLEKTAPGQYRLIECGNANRLYLVPTAVWNQVKADVLPDWSDE